MVTLLINQIQTILHYFYVERPARNCDGPYGDVADSYWLQGWWILDVDAGWDCWLGVYSKSPVGQDLATFPYCNLDAPMPGFDIERLLDARTW